MIACREDVPKQQEREIMANTNIDNKNSDPAEGIRGQAADTGRTAQAAARSTETQASDAVGAAASVLEQAKKYRRRNIRHGSEES